ncbi:hypothetical protein HY408_00955 [Candidatus Gottesmanbacteria bacterium]|nr:hypothetical protein [Candidatus Gottesmanbacteria bacterium]
MKVEFGSLWRSRDQLHVVNTANYIRYEECITRKNRELWHTHVDLLKRAGIFKTHNFLTIAPVASFTVRDNLARHDLIAEGIEMQLLWKDYQPPKGKVSPFDPRLRLGKFLETEEVEKTNIWNLYWEFLIVHRTRSMKTRAKIVGPHHVECDPLETTVTTLIALPMRHFPVDAAYVLGEMDHTGNFHDLKASFIFGSVRVRPDLTPIPSGYYLFVMIPDAMSQPIGETHTSTDHRKFRLVGLRKSDINSESLLFYSDFKVPGFPPTRDKYFQIPVKFREQQN